MAGGSFEIRTTWDGLPIDHDPVRIDFVDEGHENILYTIHAPFFDDPPSPGGQPGEPFPGLWDYEVVETFFLGDDGCYLEVEFCPHGQQLVLLLQGRRNCIKEALPLEYSATIDWEQKTWSGLASIPRAYFPPGVTAVNSYAIHGSGERRRYEALYPVLTGRYEQPDFHRLEYFQPIDFCPSSEFSKVWQDSLQPSRPS